MAPPSPLEKHPCRSSRGRTEPRLADAQASFAADYGQMVDAVLGLGLPTAVCTIYNANYAPPQRRLVVAALALFNDVIFRGVFCEACR